MIGVILVTGILALLTLFYIVNKRPPNYPPVLKVSFPVLGHFPYFGKYEKIGLNKMFVEWGQECGSPMIGIDFGNYQSVVINDYKLIREGWSKDELAGRIDSRYMHLRGGDEGVSRGLIASDGVKSVEQRKFAARHLKEFGFGKSSMEHVLLVEAEELVANLRKRSGEPIDTSYLFNAGVVNGFWQIVTGQRFAHDDPKLTQLVAATAQNTQEAKMMGIVIFMGWLCKLAPKLSGWTAYVEAFNVMNNYIVGFVEARLLSHQARDRNDFTDVYIGEMLKTVDPESSFYREEGKKYLINGIGDIFTAGVETTSTTLSWISLYLALHPKVQEKLHAEIDKVLGRSRLATLSDRPQMPYTEACIWETLRISSIVPSSVFHRATEDLTLGGMFIPNDTIVISNLYAVHHDPRIWGGNVEDFVPERFLSPNEAQLVRREEMLAFSCGKRVCLGESLARNQLFLYTASLLQSFRIDLYAGEKRPTMESSVGGIVCGPLPHKLVFNQR